jgi:hypothetical protein
MKPTTYIGPTASGLQYLNLIAVDMIQKLVTYENT